MSYFLVPNKDVRFIVMMMMQGLILSDLHDIAGMNANNTISQKTIRRLHTLHTTTCLRPGVATTCREVEVYIVMHNRLTQHASHNFARLSIAQHICTTPVITTQETGTDVPHCFDVHNDRRQTKGQYVALPFIGVAPMS